MIKTYEKIINYNPLCSFYVCAHVCAGVCVCTYVVATVMDQKRVDVLIVSKFRTSPILLRFQVILGMCCCTGSMWSD